VKTAYVVLFHSIDQASEIEGVFLSETRALACIEECKAANPRLYNAGWSLEEVELDEES
jgi:hypothetical protein